MYILLLCDVSSVLTQGSRWTLQATLMNGHVEFLNWTIKPDQMQTLVPLFGLMFLVLFDVVLYPLLAKVGIRKPLQKITLSGVLAVVAFAIAALLQFKIFVRLLLGRLIFFSIHTSYAVFFFRETPLRYRLDRAA